MPAREPREITESFRLERVLRSSRSAIVLRATDPATGEPVAIKLIPAGDPTTLAACRERFVALAEALTALHPPSFPGVRDFGFSPDGSAFLVMDFVDGKPLDTAGTLPPPRLGAVLGRAIEALGILATRGLCHGNLSPANLLLAGGDRLWILGLGTAAYRPADVPASVVDSGAVRFAAPERLGAGAVAALDWRADMYSLALTACSLLAAEIEGGDGPAPTVKLPPLVAAAMPDPNALRASLQQCLRRRPEERPASFPALREALRPAFGEPGNVVALGEKVTVLAAARPATAVAPAPVAAPAAAFAPPAAPQEIEWDEPEGAPAWLVEAPTAASPTAGPTSEELPDEARAAEGEPADEKDDTNPVIIKEPAQRPAVRAAAVAPAPPVGAPAPLPVPAIVTAPPPAPPATVMPPPAVAAAPLPPPPLIGAEPAKAAADPATAAEPATPVAAPPTHPLEATPPTGTYELPQPAEPAAATPPTAAETPAEVAAAGAPAEEGEPVVAAPEAVVKPSEKLAVPRTAPIKGKRRRWVTPAGAAVAVVIVAAVGAVVGLRLMQKRPAPVPPPTPAPVRPRPTPVPQPGVPQALLDNLLAVEEALADGDLAAAQQVLAAFTAEDELALGPIELGRLTRVRATANELRRDVIRADLSKGLADGNLRVVRDALRKVGREDEAAFTADPDTAQTLEEARRAVNLLNLATRAQQAGSNVQALEHATALVGVVPKSQQAAELRDKAAAALEREGDALLARGELDAAAGRLDSLARHWSGRPGLDGRFDRLRAARAADERMAALMAQVERTEQERRPDRGLEMLRTAQPPPGWAERVRQARSRLEEQLGELDANPPTVSLPAGLKLELQKNKPFAITVQASDDYGVRTATLFLRVKGSEPYKELVLTRRGEGEWSGEITPLLHENKAVELYVVAKDHSGHTGSLGTADAPLVLKKKWSLFGR